MNILQLEFRSFVCTVRGGSMCYNGVSTNTINKIIIPFLAL